jgi:hypothetical protein
VLWEHEIVGSSPATPTIPLVTTGALARPVPDRRPVPYRDRGRYDVQAMVHFTTMIPPTPVFRFQLTSHTPVEV